MILIKELSFVGSVTVFSVLIVIETPTSLVSRKIKNSIPSSKYVKSVMRKKGSCIVRAVKSTFARNALLVCIEEAIGSSMKKKSLALLKGFQFSVM